MRFNCCNDFVLITAMISQIFHPTGELVIPIGTPTGEKNTEIETRLLTDETRTRKCSK